MFPGDERRKRENKLNKWKVGSLGLAEKWINGEDFL